MKQGIESPFFGDSIAEKAPQLLSIASHLSWNFGAWTGEEKSFFSVTEVIVCDFSNIYDTIIEYENRYLLDS